jgi:tetratricopeptide (TPR) repeat protein
LWPFRFQPVIEGKAYFEEIESNVAARPFKERHRIDLVYGSKGNADEVYFTWSGNQLFELPFAWLRPFQRWGKQIYSDVGDRVLRTTTPRCLECHTTYFEHVPGTENEYNRDSVLMGVSCERCHGPGREHVERHRAQPGLKKGIAIVHPGQLPRERQVDLCAQCHSSALHHRAELFSYHPGDDLNEHFRSLTIDGIENDHVADQTKYMRRSKCFQKSDSLTCNTCHDPHRPTDSKKVADACLKCHQPAACRAHENLPMEVRGQCVDCHMPRYNRVAVRFRTTEEEFLFPMRPHEHQIGLYPRAHKEVLEKWNQRQSTVEGQLKAQELRNDLIDSWMKEGNDLRAADRLLAATGAYREALRFDPECAAKTRIEELAELQTKLEVGRLSAQELITRGRTGAAIETLEELLKLSPSQSTVHGRLGTLYEVQGQHAKALEHWAAVNRYDPDDPYGYNMRGWTAFLGGRHAEAIEAFRRANELLPSTAEINFRWGLACLGASDPATAAKRLRVALRVNPSHLGAIQAMSVALRQQGQAEQAASFAAEGSRRTKYADFEMLMCWVDASLDANRLDDAREAIDRAMLLVKNPNMQRAIDERVQRMAP